jgi:hypothetical protein
MFHKKHLDALFGELERQWLGKPEFEQLLRDAHLGIAQADADKPLGADIDPRVVSLIRKHTPGG